jgi:hypothetical protein
MRRVALACIAACGLACPAQPALCGDAPTATPTGTPAPAAVLPSPTATPGSVPAPPGILALASAVDSGRLSVDAELGALDGGPLSKALKRAANAGRRLRVLLDPLRAESRAVGAALASITPSTEVRWCRSGRMGRRWMDIDGLKQLAWYSGEDPRALTPASGAALERFEDDWSSGARRLPEALRLSDQLQSLPDPREKNPHYTLRQSTAGEP